MAVAVDLYVQDDGLGHNPVAGATVAVYAAGVLASMATTDAEGKAAFLLPGNAGGLSYEVRAYKLGVVFANPMTITVVEGGDPNILNVFDLVGSVITLPVAEDGRVCRCTGRFVDFSNKPMKATVRIMAQAEAGFQVPKLVDGNLVAAEGREFQTDANGFVSADLLRGGEYWVTYSGESDTVWNMKVPDRASANLIDLIFPCPVELIWDEDIAPGNAVSLAVGQQLVVPFAIRFSDYEMIGKDLSKWVEMVNLDSEVIDLGFTDSSTAAAVLKGLKAGSTNVQVTIRPNLAPKRLPDYSITAPPLSVTVH